MGEYRASAQLFSATKWHRSLQETKQHASLGSACCSLAKGERGMQEQRPALYTKMHTQRQKYQARRRDCLPLEGQVALSSPRLQGDNTGHGRMRRDAPAKGRRSCQPRGVVPLLLSPEGCPPSPPHGRCYLQPPLPAGLSPLWHPGLSGPRGSAVPCQPSASSASIPGPYLQTYGQAFYLPTFCPQTRYPPSPSTSSPSHKSHSHTRLLTTCCPQSTSTFPRLTLPFGS